MSRKAASTELGLDARRADGSDRRGRQLTFTTIGGEVVTAQRRGKHYIQPRGYFYHPGTGPEGETCGTCKYCDRDRRWAKCELNRARWTGGRGTDILTGSPACKYWETISEQNPSPDAKFAQMDTKSETHN